MTYEQVVILATPLLIAAGAVAAAFFSSRLYPTPTRAARAARGDKVGKGDLRK